MTWARTNIDSQSGFRRTAAIVAILLRRVAYQVGTSILSALGFSVAGLLSVLLMFPAGYLLEKHFQEPPGWILAIVLLAILGFESCIAILIGLKFAKWRIRTESRQWYIERSLQKADPIYHAWLRRARHLSLFAPSALALFLLLFFPETMAVASHLFRPNTGELRQYRLRIPLTWIIFHRFDEAESNHSFVALWSARGWIRSGRGSDLLASSAGLALYRTPLLNGSDLPKHAQILSSKVVSFAGAAGTCWEYRYPMHFTPRGDYRSISCSSDEGSIRAWFDGQFIDEPDFYRMIESLQKTE